MTLDQQTADAFATSWNNLPEGSIYTEDQACEWFLPLTPDDFAGKNVLELGCGNGSLMIHVAQWEPRQLVGVDLGDSVRSARANLAKASCKNCEVQQVDLIRFESDGYDIVYSIGVLHHLKEPKAGFDAVVRNTVSGGAFHCWVYAWEGNAVIRWIVDPIRRMASRLPWWLTKYFIATPLVLPYFIYAKTLAALPRCSVIRHLPLYEYSLWIAKRQFSFFRHVAFDQLVTPQTVYIRRQTIDEWLASNSRIVPQSTYILMRNGNSWKFGGTVK